MNFPSILSESKLHNIWWYKHLQQMEWWWCQAVQQDCQENFQGQKKHGNEFDQAFTERMLRHEDKGTNKYKKKRKRDMVNAYNDLKGDEESSEESTESGEDSENEGYQV